MVDITNAPNRGGILHLNRLITDEQQAVITALPPPVPQHDAMIATQMAYAAVYFPLARKRAADIGVEWPEAFETATWKKLSETLGVERPYL